MKKTPILFILLITVAFSLFSCKNELVGDDLIVGSWFMIEQNGDPNDNDFTWVIRKDGTIDYCREECTPDCNISCIPGEWSWKVPEKELSIIFELEGGIPWENSFTVEILDEEALVGKWHTDGVVFDMIFERE